MIHGLNYDEQDPNYMLLNKIFNVIDYRSTDNILARNGFKRIKRFKTAIKTIFLSSFFKMMYLLQLTNYLINLTCRRFKF